MGHTSEQLKYISLSAALLSLPLNDSVTVLIFQLTLRRQVSESQKQTKLVSISFTSQGAPDSRDSRSNRLFNFILQRRPRSSTYFLAYQFKRKALA